MAFEILSDSSCNLPVELIDRYNISIFPLTFMDESGKQYVSYSRDHKVDLKEFYDLMRSGTVFTTSLPNVADSEALLRERLNTGADLLYIGFSSALSGTYQSIKLLMEQLKSEYPERTMIAIDTYAAAGGQGLLVLKCCQMQQEGRSIQEVANWLEDNKQKMGHWFTVDDLMYLFRGGRVSKTSAWAGTLLNIKPVLRVAESGELIPMEKIRGRKKSLQTLVAHMSNALEPVDGRPVFISHGDCLEDAEYVADLVRKKYGDVEIIINYLDPVIGAHTGPGLVALFFDANDRL